MIEISKTTAITLYLFFTLMVLLGFWAYTHLKSRRKKVVISREELYLCEFCHDAYLANPSSTVTKCPSCQSYNKNNQYKKSK